MRHGCIASVVALTVITAAPHAAGQGEKPAMLAGCPAVAVPFHKCAMEKAKTFNPPRTPSGKPNFQGYWRSRLITAFSLEGVPADDPRTKLAVMPWEVAPTTIVEPADGKIPYQPWAASLGRRGEIFEKYIDPRTACNTAGVPRLALQDPSQIVQPPGDTQILWLHDDHHMFRIIPMDNRPRPGSAIKLWNGVSRGRWEGNTLVIDVTNLNAYTWIDDAGNFYTDNAHLVERLTMVDANTLLYEVTIEDSKIYTRPWKVAWAQVRVTEKDFELFEESCWEGERDLGRMREIGLVDYYGRPWKNRAQ